MDPANSKLQDAHTFPGTSPVAIVSTKSTTATTTATAATLPDATAPHLPAEHTNLDLPESLKNEAGQPLQVDGSVQVNAPVEAIPAQQHTVPTDATETQHTSQHAVPEHPQDGQSSQHTHEITEGLHHDLHQGEEVPQPVTDGQLTEAGKHAVAVQQQHVVQPQEGVHASEHIHAGAAEAAEATQHHGPVHSHVQDIPEQELPHEQLHQQIEGEEVQTAEHHPPIQQEAVIHTTQHEQGHKMEEVMQQPLQEAAQPLEQEHEHTQMQAQGHQMRESAQEQYQEHMPHEQHEQSQEQLAEQQQLQSQQQEELVEHHPEHEQAQVQEHQVPHQHHQHPQAQELQARQDSVPQQMNPALATVVAAAAATVASSEKVVYDQVMEHARYQQPIANPIDSPRQAPPISSPETTPRRGAERYHASGEQLRTLVEAFEQDPTPSVQTLNFLSSSIGMPMHNLVLWFKNRRARHKKTHPNQPLKSGRRSYVKSGIYSRAKRGKQQQQAATSAGLRTTMQQSTHQQIPSGIMLPPDPIDGQAVPDLPPDQKQEMDSSIRGDLTGAKRPLDDHGMVGPTVPKRTKYVGIKELIGDENPCRLWDGQECHRRCIEFFERTSGGCHPEQANAARVVSAEFFLSELQSGLTMTSAMQPLETSVAILDNIMDRLPTDGPKLSSGSRVILREFFAQMRSGSAVNARPESNIVEAGVNLATPPPEDIAAGEIAEEGAPAEEHVAEENVAEHNVAEQNVAENVAEDNVAEQNVAEENVVEENVAEENVAEESVAEESVAEENVTEENVAEENVTQENVTENVPEDNVPEESTAEENVVGESAVADSAGVDNTGGGNGGGDSRVGEHATSEVVGPEAGVTEEQQTQ